MAAKKKTTKKQTAKKRSKEPVTKKAKAEKKAKEPAARVGPFLATSETGKIFQMLSDGKAHSSEEIIKETKPATGKIRGKMVSIMKHGRESGEYELVRSDAGYAMKRSSKK